MIRHPFHRVSLSLACVGVVVEVLAGVAAVAVAPRAQADALAYLVGVTMRPGYNFADADAALAYG